MTGPDTTAALYLHVPFCLGKCRYCDFYSVPLDPSLARRYVAAIRRRLQQYAGLLAKPLKTVFLGGGTPSVLGADLLAELIEPIRPFLSAETEFSVEANPGAIDGNTLAAMTAGGVSRVSLGVQSFDDSQLAALGRPHTSRQALDAIDALGREGMNNWSLDLIYALPGQSLEGWMDTLRQALTFRPPHLSCYALSFEPGTELHEALAAGDTAEMPDDRQRRCYDAACEVIASAGLEHYELSNFARPGKRCRHNLTYWRNEPYLGLGPAAASYVGGERRTNRPDLAAWLEAVEADRTPPAESERLTGPLGMAETLMLSLRLTDGVDRAAFVRRHGVDPAEAFPETTDRYRREGMLIVDADHIRLAPPARFVADAILADFIAEAHAAQ